MRILLPSLLLLAACTPSEKDLQRQADAQAGTRAALEAELAGLVAGPPQTCVRQQDLRDQKAYGDTLVYRLGRDRKFVNVTSGGCDQIGEDSILITRTPSTQTCRGDIATTVSRTSQVLNGSCTFGDFVPYNRP